MMRIVINSSLRYRFSSVYPSISPEKWKNDLPSIINHSSGGFHVAVDSIQFCIELKTAALFNCQVTSDIEKLQPN
jgi:hypothetical protein